VHVTVVVGNPKPASRTLGVALTAAGALADSLDLRRGPQLVDLSGLARRLLLPEPSAALEDAVDQVRSSELLLVASPTFKGTYSGLLKVFLDRLPYRALEGVTALPLLVMNSRQHADAVEAHLRPLLAELGATVPAPGLAVLDSELGQLDPVLRRWAGMVTSVLGSAGLLRRAGLGDSTGPDGSAGEVGRSAAVLSGHR
jgi:FMN reductase